MNAETLKVIARGMRLLAVQNLRDHRERWPHVPEKFFGAVEGALGDISVDEAFAALDREEKQLAGTDEGAKR